MNKHCDFVIDYFNEQLTDEKRIAFEEHLQNCSDCQEELKDLQALTEDLGFDVEPIEPPIKMKARILDEVFNYDNPSSQTNIDVESDVKQTEELPRGNDSYTPIDRDPLSQEKVRETRPKRSPTWLMPTMAAALLLSLLGNVYSFSQITSGPEEPIAPDPEAIVSVDSLERTVNLQPSANADFQATALLVNKRDESELIVQAQNLTQTNENEVYQVWLLKDGEPYRAGTFTPNADGAGASTFTINDPTIPFDTIAITIEPDSTSETPLGEIILSEVIY